MRDLWRIILFIWSVMAGAAGFIALLFLMMLMVTWMKMAIG